MENTRDAERVGVEVVENDVGSDWKTHHAFVYLLTRASNARILRQQLTRGFDSIKHALDSTRPFGSNESLNLFEISYRGWRKLE